MPEEDHGQHAGFATERAAAKRAKDNDRTRESTEGLLRKGLDTEVVDDPNYTPDLFRIQGLIKAGIWPRPRQASQLPQVGEGIGAEPLADRMVALGYGTGNDAKLLVLRPYRDNNGQLMLRGIVTTNSAQQQAAENQADSESMQWGAVQERTGIPWEGSANHGRQRIVDVPAGEARTVGQFVKGLIEGKFQLQVTPWNGRGEPTKLDIPRDPFVFVNQSNRLVHEQQLFSLKEKAKGLLPRRQQTPPAAPQPIATPPTSK